jgi:hypothetical protein
MSFIIVIDESKIQEVRRSIQLSYRRKGGHPPFLHAVFEIKSKSLVETAYPPTTGDPQRSSNTVRRGRCNTHTVFHYTTRSCAAWMSDNGLQISVRLYRIPLSRQQNLNIRKSEQP